MERLSVFDMLKIGVGPSSSHTMGPWRAAQRFLAELPPPGIDAVTGIKIDLYGSLAKTGRGHGTDIAVQLGLCGEDPETIDVESLGPRIEEIKDSNQLCLLGSHEIAFDPQRAIEFLDQRLQAHPNGIRFTAEIPGSDQYTATYYSIGGGFVVREGETMAVREQEVPYPINSAAEMLAYCDSHGCGISTIVMQNELHWRGEAEVLQGLARIRDAMLQSVYRGCHTGGELPGGLHVKRRAARTARLLLGMNSVLELEDWFAAIKRSAKEFSIVLDWVSCFALAVNEENAAFGRIVTAPTNGAAGVLPAVMLYALRFCDVPDDAYENFLLTAGQIGSLFKQGATISAALGGCQAEIGVSSAMAAAALTEVLGGTPQQVVIAAEVAMEHHLGMTCDPIGGLVQIPCIERNAFGAVKAITAAQMALKRDPTEARVSLDTVIETMWQTAQDMNEKYKETSEGGLALQIPVNVSEC